MENGKLDEPEAQPTEEPEAPAAETQTAADTARYLRRRTETHRQRKRKMPRQTLHRKRPNPTDNPKKRRLFTGSCLFSFT